MSGTSLSRTRSGGAPSREMERKSPSLRPNRDSTAPGAGRLAGPNPPSGSPGTEHPLRPGASEVHRQPCRFWAIFSPKSLFSHVSRVWKPSKSPLPTRRSGSRPTAPIRPKSSIFSVNAWIRERVLRADPPGSRVPSAFGDFAAPPAWRVFASVPEVREPRPDSNREFGAPIARKALVLSASKSLDLGSPRRAASFSFDVWFFSLTVGAGRGRITANTGILP